MLVIGIKIRMVISNKDDFNRHNFKADADDINTMCVEGVVMTYGSSTANCIEFIRKMAIPTLNPYHFHSAFIK